MVEPTNEPSTITDGPRRPPMPTNFTRYLTPNAQTEINRNSEYKKTYLENRKKNIEILKKEKEERLRPLKEKYAMYNYQIFSLGSGTGRAGSKQFKRVVNNINGGPFLFYDWVKKNKPSN